MIKPFPRWVTLPLALAAGALLWAVFTLVGTAVVMGLIAMALGYVR